MFEKNYDQVADAIQAVKATIDDVDSVTVCYTTAVTNNEGEPLPEVGMILHYCTGRQGILSRNVSACLLNDGILSRLRIPIEFV